MAVGDQVRYEKEGILYAKLCESRIELFSQAQAGLVALSG